MAIDMVRYMGAAVERLWRVEVAYGGDMDLETFDQLSGTGLPFMVLGPERGNMDVHFPCGCRISTWEGEFDEHLSHWCFEHDPEGGLEDEIKDLYLYDVAKEAMARGRSRIEVLLEEYQKGDKR